MNALKTFLTCLTVSIHLAGCGGIEGVSQSKALALLDDFGRAVVAQDWEGLAALHASTSGVTAEALAAEFGGYSNMIGSITDVTSTGIDEIEGAAKSELVSSLGLASSADSIRCIGRVIVGNGPESKSPAFEGVRVEVIIGEENGRYVVLTISSASVID
ncbi:MAG: hypothetical protein JNK74_11770 [Candidatus Hydrogenedentes bacterium]|nr:hypothetical protein [Candidatus Hydrogenedentota bacterium]